MESGNHMDTEKLLIREEYSDFTILLKDGCEVKCHKFMLARASPVFRMSLRNDDVETRTWQWMTLDAFEP